MSAKIFSLIAGKGGVGKTTIGFNLGFIAQKYHKKKILFVDCDPQCGLEQTLFRDRGSHGIAQIIRHKKNVKDLILTAEEFPGIAFLGSGGGLIKEILPYLEVNPQTLINILGQILEEFDYIFIDSSPNIDALTQNIIHASDHILLPYMADTTSLASLGEALKGLKHKKCTVIPSIHHSKTNIQKWIDEEVKELVSQYEDVEITDKIRFNINIREFQGNSTFKMCGAARDMRDIGENLFETGV